MRDVPNKASLRSGIFTPSELHRAAHHLDRLASADVVLDAMRRGASLHLQYTNGRPFWSLSTGRAVSADVASLLTNHASVAPVGDALFTDIPAQTWRFAS
jgi:hypothetical protein